MADLDDFFAKKDKKKAKTKKFLSSEELVKQLEQTAKENEQDKKPTKIEEEPSDHQIETTQEQDDEWKEFEEEKPVDLSNLKLGQLNIDDNSEHNQNYGSNDYDNDNSQYDGDSSENPWNMAKNVTSASATTVPEAAKQTKAPGVYVPPSVTRQENALKARGNRKNAPDLRNEEFFPSLGTEKPSVEQVKSYKKDGFEEVKHGGKLQSPTVGPSSVSVGNTYSSLLSDTIDS